MTESRVEGGSGSGAGSRNGRGGWAAWRRRGALVATVWLISAVALAMWRTRHWPLVNDAALMHYVVFLMRQGLAPYREIQDINLPGAYVLEWVSTAAAAVLHLPLAAMWRVVDGLLMLFAAGAMVWIAGRRRWFAGLFAGAMFALYHGRDGVGQAGQRDLVIAVLLLWAVGVVLAAFARTQLDWWWPGSFGLLIGAAATIKPMEAIYLVALLPLLRGRKGFRLQICSIASAGFLLAMLGPGVFLLYWHAVPAFLEVLRVELPYHAGLARGNAWQLLGASSIPSIQKLFGLTLGTILLMRCSVGSAGQQLGGGRPIGGSGRVELRTLVLCVGLGLLTFLVQGKGYPYQRYPYVAFLWLLAALLFSAAVRAQGRALRSVGTAGFAFGVLLCAPGYLHAVGRASWPTVTASIKMSLLRQGAPQQLQGQVQCLDTVAGCTDALLALRLREASGTIYDEFLFPQLPAPWGTPHRRGAARPVNMPTAVVRGQRRFEAQILAHPPRIFVLSAWLFPQGPGDYDALALWPWFEAWLTEHYTLVEQQRFAQAENGPMGFRVYVRRAEAFR